ncbi:MAG: anthranilate phosphoribosyltransferase [Thermodesulfobacteriota bacterium]
MIKEAIAKVARRIDLTEIEMEKTMDEIMTGTATPAQIGSFITGLSLKGETVDEITGAAKVMRAKAMRIGTRDGEWVVDTCGTGGDGKNTFNISTGVALVAAGGGLIVAKHGNRSVSSRCGSADVFEALGVNIHLPPERVQACLQEVGLAFLFAPLFHPAMKYSMAPRKEIGIRTIFNILGPLTNPAGANIQLLGVNREDLIRPVAEVLRNLGSKAAFVVHGEDHCDEISITGKTTISQLKDGVILNYQMEPEMVGLKRAGLEEIQGGTPEENAKILLKVLLGEPGASRDVILLNAAAVFTAAEKVSALQDGMEMAKESIDSGMAIKKLKEFIQFSNHMR